MGWVVVSMVKKREKRRQLEAEMGMGMDLEGKGFLMSCGKNISS